jgi:hypothetical protein
VGHDGEELGEVDLAVAVLVHLLDHLQQLILRRVQPQLTHHDSQLLSSDAAVPVLVEHFKSLLKLINLVLTKLIFHSQ